MFLLLTDLIVVEQVLGEEADHLVSVLDPILQCYLYALAGEELIVTVPYRNVLRIEDNHRLLAVHQGLTRLVLVVYLRKQVVYLRRRLTVITFAFALLLLVCRLLFIRVNRIHNVHSSALDPLQRVSEQKAPDEILLVRRTLLACADLLLSLSVRS